jgi:carotenoid cleavage dioxygenase-like enzyme
LIPNYSQSSNNISEPNTEPQSTPVDKQLHFPKSVLTLEQNELDIELQELDGKVLPTDLRGYLFITTALFVAKSTRKNLANEQQVYNGDGMIYRLSFTNVNGKVKAHLKTRITKPPCYYADQATRCEKYQGFKFHNAGYARLGKLGSRNQLNTAFATFGDRLFVTFDAGRPYEIDPSSLEVLAPVGSAREWLSPLPEELTGNILFSPHQTPAHPIADPQGGEFFTANYSTGLSRILPAIVRENLNPQIKKCLQGYTDLIRWKGDGQLERWRLTLKNGDPVIIEQSLHQIAVTQHHLVLVDIAFSTEISQLFLPILTQPWLEKIPFKRLKRGIKSQLLRLRTQLPFTNVYLVKRSDLENQGSAIGDQQELNQNSLKTLIVKKIVLPREISHFVTDYTEEPEGRIILHAAHNNTWDVSEWIRDWDEPAFPLAGLRSDLPGMLVGPVDVSFLGRYVIDAVQDALLDTKVVCDPQSTWSISLYSHPDIKYSPTIKTIYWLAWGFYRELVPKRIYDAYKNYRYRGIATQNFTTSRDECQDKLPHLIKLNTTELKIERNNIYSFPDNYFPSSPQFIPKLDNPDEGYIVCTVISDCPKPPNSTGDEIWIFDTQELSKGPKYKLGDRCLNFGLTIHTTWLSEIKEGHSENDAQKIREESFDDDYASLIQELTDTNKQDFPDKEFFAELRQQFITQGCSTHFYQDKDS